MTGRRWQGRIAVYKICADLMAETILRLRQSVSDGRVFAAFEVIAEDTFFHVLLLLLVIMADDDEEIFLRLRNSIQPL